MGANLVSRKVNGKRNRVISIVFLPALIFIVVAGWFMYAIGDTYKTTRNKPTRPSKKDNVTLLPTFLENHQEKRIKN
jgi:hypothetical protein